MTPLNMLWEMWAHLFSSIPYGDPWAASFAMVFALVMVGKMIKSIMEFA